jgi:hypothetical protein
MHPSLVMLDKAIAMGRREFAELELLELEGAAGLEESAGERARLIDAAWAGKSGCNTSELHAKLSVLQELQKRLNNAARERFEETREELKVRRQAGRAINGYGNKLRRSVRAQMLAGSY